MPTPPQTLPRQPRSRELDSSLNLAGQLYWDPEVLTAEMDRLFSNDWLCVGRSEDLGRSGDFLTLEVGADPILVLRGDDGEVRAFYNVCRHRGTRLMERRQGSDLGNISCPYHGWTYNGRGELIAAPKMGSSPSFCRSDFSLVDVGVGEWNGFVFVNLDSDSESLKAAFADAPDLSGYGPEQLRRGSRREYVVSANWKILCENYSECYHCALVHPHLHRLSDGAGTRDPQDGVCYNGGPMSMKPGFTSMTLTGRTQRRPFNGLSEVQRTQVEYFVLYPNLLLSLHPDYVLATTVWPLEAGRSSVVCEWFFAADEMERDGFDPSDAVDFWDLTNLQDWKLCEGVQRGVRSRGHRPGRYQSQEDCVFFFDRWYLESMGW